MHLENYFETAQKNEEIFRNILRDLSTKEYLRPQGGIVPIDLNPEEELAEIYLKYSSPAIFNQFTILYFKIDERGRALIAFDDIGDIEKSSGGSGVELAYKINENKSVEFITDTMEWTFRR
ncbi:MAG: hypothetical protein WCK29_04285 [archaeon]